MLDLYECRVVDQLDTMGSTILLPLPTTESWTPDYFLTQSKARCEAGGLILKAASKRVEDSVKELIDLLHSSANLPTIHDFDSEETCKSKTGEFVQTQYS